MAFQELFVTLQNQERTMVKLYAVVEETDGASSPAQEYDKFRVVQDRMYMSDFDKEVKRLKGEMGIE